MSDASVSLPHVLTGSRRCGTAGYAIPRPVHLHMPQLPRPLRSSNTALVLATKLILPPDKPYGPITVSQLVTDTASANHKSP